MSNLVQSSDEWDERVVEPFTSQFAAADFFKHTSRPGHAATWIRDDAGFAFQQTSLWRDMPAEERHAFLARLDRMRIDVVPSGALVGVGRHDPQIMTPQT